MDKKLQIEFRDITIRRGLKNLIPGAGFSVFQGDNFLVTGENGSGKSSLMDAVAGKASVCSGSVLRYHSLPLSSAIFYISFEKLRIKIRKDNLIKDAEFYSGKDISPFIQDLIDIENRVFSSLSSLKNKKLSHLSSGEIKKLQIIEALSKNPEILILDEPFDGLDLKSFNELKNLIHEISKSEITLFLVSHRYSQIQTDNFRHISILDNRLFIKDFISKNDVKPKKENYDFSSVFQDDQNNFHKKIISIKNACVKYDGKIIFSNLNFTVNKGEKWLVQGKNGCGKSTLVSLITGSHPQVYSNNVEVFGIKPGFSTPIGEIRKNIGIVSPEIHLANDKKISAFNVVGSGFFDSIGIYQKLNNEQKERINELFVQLDLSHLKDENFLNLSYGQQRIILILRCLVKNPLLIIMDEPCLGLDWKNMEKVLSIVNSICKNQKKTLIYITHSERESALNFSNFFKF